MAEVERRAIIEAEPVDRPADTQINGQEWWTLSLMPEKFQFDTPIPQLTVSLMGTDAMGAEVFKGLLLQRHKFKAIFAPDNPKDALRKAVEEENEKREDSHKIKLFDLNPNTMKDPETVDRFSDENTELGIFASVTYIAPKEIYEGPRKSTIGIHDSYLDEGRGGNAAGNAILKTDKSSKNGDHRMQVSGVTVYEVAEGEDEGDKFFQQKTAIWDTDTPFNLFPDSTLPIGSQLMLNTVEMFARGLEDQIRTPQDLSIDTKEQLLGKRGIDWNRPSVEIYDELRGSLPFMPYAILNPGEEVDIESYLENPHNVMNIRSGVAWLVDRKYPNVEAGTVVEIGKDGMVIATVDGAIRVKRVQDSRVRKGNKTGRIIEFDADKRGKTMPSEDYAQEKGIEVGYKFISPKKQQLAA